MQADRRDKSHITKQCFLKLTDMEFGIALTEAFVVHHLFAVMSPTLGKGVADIHLSEFRLRTICVEKLNEVTRIDLVHRRKEQTALAGNVVLLLFRFPGRI